MQEALFFMIPKLQKQKFNRLIADDIRNRILSGVYEVGSLLPTEPVLAAEYGSNRNTLREGIRILETQGFVSVRQGEGVRVVNFKQHPTIEVVAYLLAQPNPPPETANIVVDLLGLRRLLADEMAHQATGNVSAETAREIRVLLTAMANPGMSEGERTQADMKILESFVRSTGSIVYSALFNSIYRVFAAGAAESQALTTIPHDYGERMETILQHLLAGEGFQARVAMRELCDASDAVLLGAIQETLAQR